MINREGGGREGRRGLFFPFYLYVIPPIGYIFYIPPSFPPSLSLSLPIL